MASATANQNDRTRAMKTRLEEVMQSMREDVRESEDPKLKALLETSAEVIGGITRAFDHYENRSEEAWRD